MSAHHEGRVAVFFMVPPEAVAVMAGSPAARLAPAVQDFLRDVRTSAARVLAKNGIEMTAGTFGDDEVLWIDDSDAERAMELLLPWSEQPREVKGTRVRVKVYCAT
jgi:hypothetical protein